MLKLVKYFTPIWFLTASCGFNLLLSDDGAPCNSDDNCPANQQCIAGNCSAAATQDAGPGDAGPVDASSGDAAQHDATNYDTGLVDTAHADSTAPDRQGTDSQATDTNHTDSNLSDSSLVDTTLADTTLPDSAQPDAGPPNPLVMSAGTHPHMLIVHDGWIYFTAWNSTSGSGGSVRRLKTDGTDPMTLATISGETPHALTIMDNLLYFIGAYSTGYDDGHIYSLPLDASLATPTIIAADTSINFENIGNILFSHPTTNHGNCLFWLEWGHVDARNIGRYCPEDTVAQVRYAKSLSYPTGLIVLGDNLFWAGNNYHSVNYTSSDFLVTDEPGTITTFDDEIYAAHADENHAFWGSKKTADSVAKIYELDSNGNASIFIAQIDPENTESELWELAVRGNSLYYTVVYTVSQNYYAKLFAYNSTTQNPILIDEGQEFRGVALDDNYVYYADFAARTITRRIKEY